MGEKKSKKKKKAKEAKKAKKARKKSGRLLEDVLAGKSTEEEAAELIVGDALRARTTADEVVATLAARMVREIPGAHRVQVPAEVAVPAIRHLSRMRGDDPRAHMLRQMVLRGGDRRSACQVHGHFAELVAQMFPDEARLLRRIARGDAVVRMEAAYATDDGMYRIWAVDCEQRELDSSARVLSYLEHLRAMHLIRLVTGSPPGLALRNGAGRVVGHLVNHRATVTDYGAELCAICFLKAELVPTTGIVPAAKLPAVAAGDRPPPS